ncbi:zinc finger CCCH domain-containing protein 14-like [Triticum dicoccoides]|uniref:C3H1-type domain-containing protein n=1 Tax=Triticum aestivum TaxID=4565 RepID=A0A3B6NM97_WHEAT|nr:zinc finger CCCH domain-containing protein 14-like [Triticum dicoccoides]
MDDAREEEGREKRITYSRELLLAVGGSEACKALPAGRFHLLLSNDPSTVTLWASGAARGCDCSSRAEARGARPAGRACGAGHGALPRRAREPESFQTGVGSKSKPWPCTRFFSTAGCRFGEDCLFTHDFPGGYQAVANLGSLGGEAPSQDEKELSEPLSQDKSAPPHIERGTAGRHAPPLAPNPGTAAPAGFGAPATARITVDASLAGAVIGRGGATIREISRASGARLRIRDHERDAGLKNVELEGTPDQIRHASAMVWEHLPVPGGGRYNGLKTRLCAHFARGSCTYGDGCRFAHSESELRRPAPAAREPCGW